MKFASFRVDGRDTYGVAASDARLIDLRAAAGAPETLLAFIESGESGLDLARNVLANAKAAPRVDANSVEWLPPVTRPGKICGIAMNNSASNERKISAPQHPAFFVKPASCLIGHKGTLEIRSYYGSVHPEPELAVVIGRKARDLAAKDAPEHVFGYSIFNDFTGNGMRAEDLFHYYALYPSGEDPGKLERREQHLSYAGRYKGTDGFGAMGPWLVTRDEIADPDNLSVTCKVAGELVAEDSTRYYNYKVAELVSFLSQFLTLHPGDVISCGTAFKPSQNRQSIHHANLQHTDGPVEVHIEGLGTQEIAVARKKTDIGRWRL